MSTEPTQRGFAKIAKYRNSNSANPLRTLRTTCSRPQRARRCSASADRRSSAGLSNRLLVGKITIRVNGMTLPSRTPASSHKSVAPASHAAMDDSRPKVAEVTCP